MDPVHSNKFIFKHEDQDHEVEVEQLMSPWGAPPLLMHDEIPMDWIVRDVLPAGDLSLLIAPGGAGKSLALLDLVLSRSVGRLWLDRFEVQKGRSLLISGEDKRREIHNRMLRWVRARVVTDSEVAAIYKGDSRFDWMPLVEEPDGEGALGIVEKSKVIDEYGPLVGSMDLWAKANPGGLIVIDPLNPALAGAYEDNENFGLVANALSKLCSWYSITVLVCHHESKAALTSNADHGAYGARGGSVLVDRARWACTVKVIESKNALKRFEIVNCFHEGSLDRLMRFKLSKWNGAVQPFTQYAYVSKDGVFKCLDQPVDERKKTKVERRADRGMRVYDAVWELLSKSLGLHSATELRSNIKPMPSIDEVREALNEMLDVNLVVAHKGAGDRYKYRIK